MALTIKHSFVSAIADGGDNTLVQPSNWNAAHTLTGTLDASSIAAAGSSGQIQFNSSGALGAMSGTSWDDTNRSLTLTGTTVTASNPVLSLSQTWNNAAVNFTGVLINITPSAAGASSLALDVQSAGSTLFNVAASGLVTSTFQFNCGSNVVASGFIITGGGTGSFTSTYGFQTSSNGYFSFSSTSATPATPDLFLYRDGANTLAQRNSTNAQTLRVYNTYTDAANYERGIFDWNKSAGFLTIGTEAAGTGAQRDLHLLTGSVISMIQGASTVMGTFSLSGSSLQLGIGSTFLLDNGSTAKFSMHPQGNDVYFENTNTSGRLYFTGAGAPLSGDIVFQSSGLYYFGTGGTGYTSFKTENSNIFSQLNSTNAQTFRIYNTYTDASNYERASIGFPGGGYGGGLVIAREHAGSGAANLLYFNAPSGIMFQISGTNAWHIDGAGELLAASDNTFDIGASGANRPHNIYFATGLVPPAGATNQTSGFVWIPAAAGAATGTPGSPPSGAVPMYYDTTNNNFYVYNSGWKKVGLA